MRSNTFRQDEAVVAPVVIMLRCCLTCRTVTPARLRVFVREKLEDNDLLGSAALEDLAAAVEVLPPS